MVLAAIEEAMDKMDTKITWQDIANAAGITKSALSHFKKGTELKFPTLLKIAKFIFKKDYFTTFKTWCLKLHHPTNVRFALEYLAVNKLTSELDELVNKILKEQSNKELLEWANAYEIQVMLLKYIPPREILNKVRLFDPKYTETKILLTIIEAVCKLRLREYDSLAAIIEGLDPTIDEAKEDFIKESYKIRVKELLSHVSLYSHNNPELARKHANEIISSDFCATLTAHSFYIVGMSYLFTNYDKCLGNIEKYRDLLIDLGRSRDAKISQENDIPFINNVWKKATKQPDTSDIPEIAHYEAVLGSKEKAIQLIDKVIEEKGVNGFNLYYKALATGDLSLFMQSMVYFVTKSGGKYYANLPYQYLKNDPTFAPIANLLLND